MGGFLGGGFFVLVFSQGIDPLFFYPQLSTLAPLTPTLFMVIYSAVYFYVDIRQLIFTACGFFGVEQFAVRKNVSFG